MRIAELEKRAALQVLVYLYLKIKNGEDPKATVTELRKSVKAALDSIYTALELLQKLGFVKREVSERFPFATYYSLTETGREVAEKLAEVEELLNRRVSIDA